MGIAEVTVFVAYRKFLMLKIDLACQILRIFIEKIFGFLPIFYM
jgi:hypothetical protein